ncbi:MAG: undecaprenyl/decaprenyl-phosphate alpha-N-acetylglucosaminyl 1-phosphate transferase [Phycisphaeraceae bacterium]|nr:undecaprenyl/decaprenyl-phosphate alpha-N-acetylglucosaminyl 1-phosphate transferase [Phycisphaeraceae bacterium]
MENVIPQTMPVSLFNRVDEVISPYMGVFFAAFLISFAMTPLMRRLALANGIVDWPDLKRKAHVEPVAYLGGIAIFLGWLAGISSCLFVSDQGLIPGSHVDFPLSILVGAAAIIFIGLWDDVAGISPRVKVGGQLFAAAALAAMKGSNGQMLGAKLVITTMSAVGIDMNPFLAYCLGTAIIAMFVLGGCNSMNLLDGLDGLAAGVSAIAVTGFLLIAVYVAISAGDPQAQADLAGGMNRLYNSVRIVMCLAILGALLGFLPYNFNPANIFMGDAGSLLVGYLCVSTILLFAHAEMMGPFLVLAALIVFAVPITDTTLAIIRRKLRGQPIFSPDNQHLHHQLLRAVKNLKLGPNFSVKLTVLLIYLMGVVFASLGFALIFLRVRYVLAVFLVFFSFVFVMAYKLGHQQARSQPAQDAASKPEPSGPEASPDPLASTSSTKTN